MPCPICQKRKAARFCPAKGEKICPVCCGTEREVSISCPPDCAYLIAAHRYEAGHPRSIPADTPLLEQRLPKDIVFAQQQLVAAIAFQIMKFCAARADVADPDVLAALQSLAETYRTLRSGVYYEKPPDLPLQRDMYSALVAFLDEVKQQHIASPDAPPVKDSDIFYVLVFLYRMGLLRSNGRSRSRRYIEVLRSQFPHAEELPREESRIIVP